MAHSFQLVTLLRPCQFPLLCVADLSTRCDPGELVKILNDLFGRFDRLSQDTGCLRIKLLGDCYYCVAGLPISRPDHADCCVSLARQMISAIQAVRQTYPGADLDMRIGEIS